MPGAAGGQEGCLLGKIHGVGGDARAAEGRPHGERAAGAWVVHLRDFNAITSSWLRVGQTPATVPALGPGEESEHPRKLPSTPLHACTSFRAGGLKPQEFLPAHAGGQKFSAKVSARPGPLSKNSGGQSVPYLLLFLVAPRAPQPVVTWLHSRPPWPQGLRSPLSFL